MGLLTRPSSRSAMPSNASAQMDYWKRRCAKGLAPSDLSDRRGVSTLRTPSREPADPWRSAPNRRNGMTRVRVESAPCLAVENGYSKGLTCGLWDTNTSNSQHRRRLRTSSCGTTGARAMYAERQAAGEARLKQARPRCLSRVTFGGPPCTTTAGLLEEIRPAVPEGSEHLGRSRGAMIALSKLSSISSGFRCSLSLWAGQLPVT